jgi:hypothetical protein
MKKRETTPKELKNIIDLRQLGSSWTKIAIETKVERRAAKRAYDEWEHDKEIKERDAVRFRVAAEAWQEHMNDLVSLASGLVSKLSVSTKLADLEEKSEQFFSSLWKEDLLQRFISPETGEKIYPGDLATYYREQELLFESLKAHTKGKVQWDLLDVNWKEAKDKCANIVPQLKKEISLVVGNSIVQQKMASSLEKAKEGTSDSEDPRKRIEEVILTHIWQSVFWDKLDLGSPKFEMEIDGKIISVKSRDIYVRSRDVIVFTFTDKSNKDLAEKLTHLCNSVVNTLIKGNEIQSLYSEVGNIKKAHQELGEMLTPVKLKPIIIHSRCELCPV